MGNLCSQIQSSVSSWSNELLSQAVQAPLYSIVQRALQWASMWAFEVMFGTWEHMFLVHFTFVHLLLAIQVPFFISILGVMLCAITVFSPARMAATYQNSAGCRGEQSTAGTRHPIHKRMIR